MKKYLLGFILFVILILFSSMIKRLMLIIGLKYNINLFILYFISFVISIFYIYRIKKEFNFKVKLNKLLIVLFILFLIPSGIYTYGILNYFNLNLLDLLLSFGRIKLELKNLDLIKIIIPIFILFISIFGIISNIYFIRKEIKKEKGLKIN